MSRLGVFPHIDFSPKNVFPARRSPNTGALTFDLDFELFRLNRQGKAPLSITDVEGASPRPLTIVIGL